LIRLAGESAKLKFRCKSTGKFATYQSCVDADNATIEAAAKAAEKAQPFLAGRPSESHHRSQEDGD